MMITESAADGIRGARRVFSLCRGRPFSRFREANIGRVGYGKRKKYGSQFRELLLLLS
jgi:hypothetical protein